jgi:hypothetical protein
MTPQMSLHSFSNCRLQFSCSLQNIKAPQRAQ